MKTLIIAEAGVNHNGDMQLAKKLIAEAALAGADLVKFQSFVAKDIASKDAPKAGYQLAATDNLESQYEMLSKLELSYDDHVALKNECVLQGIGFFSTAFDNASFDTLVELGLDIVKIPSGEITNLPYLRYVTRLGHPVLLSTGMASLGEIEAAIEVIEIAGTNRDDITVLHCSTEYPTPMCEVNLKAMQNIGTAFGTKIGYSDHSKGIEVAIAAVALGASVIEKHFTLDRTLAGPDHRASLEPAELKAMVSGIRNIEIALGDGVKKPGKSELLNKPIARRSLVAGRSIKSGEEFTEQNMSVKRPGNGLSPMLWDEVLGKKAPRDFSPFELIEL